MPAIQILSPLNSAANPLIYCLFSTNIGATICNIVCCRKKTEVLPTGLTTSTHSTSSQSRTALTNSSNIDGKNHQLQKFGPEKFKPEPAQPAAARLPIAPNQPPTKENPIGQQDHGMKNKAELHEERPSVTFRNQI